MMAPADREAAFLTGQPICKARDGREWHDAARAYLAKAVAGASGATTVRVSVAALDLLLRSAP